MKYCKQYGMPLFAYLSLLLMHQSELKANGKSFFSTRPIQSNLAVAETSAKEFARKHHKTNRSLITVTPFYQQSNASKDLRRYFFPNGKDELIIKGASAPDAANCDISGTWLQIAGYNGDLPDDSRKELYLNQFESTIAIKPQLKQWGCNLGIKRYFNAQTWIDAQLPLVHAESNLRLNEYNKKNSYDSLNSIRHFTLADTTGGGGITRLETASYNTPLNATQAFNNPSWQFGKLKNGKNMLEGFGDLSIKFGSDIHKNISCYAQATLPTSKKRNSHYMFSPALGNGSHFGLGAGSTIYLPIWHNKTISLDATTHGHYEYLFENKQYRTYDLNNGPWTRYLLFAIRKPSDHKPYEQMIPGVNILTLKTRVEPTHTGFLTSSIQTHWKKNITFTLGHNIWMKSAERLEINNTFDQDYFIASPAFGDKAVTAFLLNSLSNATINTPYNTPGSVAINHLSTPLKLSDLNKDSARHPSALSNSFFSACQFLGTYKGLPIQFEVGGNYELPHNNHALKNWMVWLSYSCYF